MNVDSCGVPVDMSSPRIASSEAYLPEESSAVVEEEPERPPMRLCCQGVLTCPGDLVVAGSA